MFLEFRPWGRRGVAVNALVEVSIGFEPRASAGGLSQDGGSASSSVLARTGFMLATGIASGIGASSATGIA